MGDRRGPVLLLGGSRSTIDGTLVMGVVNASPESFSDSGRFRTLDDQIGHALSLVDAGADVVDVGGQSAITNQPEISADREIERVVPIVAALHEEHPELLISVDTYKPAVAEAAAAAGACIVNDVSGLRYPEIVEVCVRHRAALVVMHTSAPPKQRLQDPSLYADVGDEVIAFLHDRVGAAVALGIDEEAVIVDPGPDFTKTPHQTVAVLRRISDIRSLGRPILLALSRKDFLGAITGRSPRGREAATHAAVAHFVSTPGNIVRVHDVQAARDVIATVEVLAGLRDLDRDCMLPDEIRHEPSVS